MEYRKVSLSNLSRLSEMFKLCLNRDVDESYFVWKYQNNPSGEVIAFEAVEGDTIAAFYGLIPEKYYIGSEEYIVYQSMDTMTHPNFQKKGLFTKLAQMTYDYLIEKHGSVYIVGIPGGNSFHGFVHKLNWKNIYNFKYLFLQRHIASVSSLFAQDKDWVFDYAAQGDKALLDILDENDWNSNQKIKPKIDAAIFDWKVWNHPFKKFLVVKISFRNTLCGFCVCSIDDSNYLKIEQLEIKTGNKTKMMRSLCKFLFKTNPSSNFIYTWNPTDKQLAGAYKKAFFIKNPMNKGLFSYTIPFITYAPNAMLWGKNWHDISDFDVQPFLQD